MARFQDVLAALKQLRDTEKTKYGIMEKTGQNQTDMVKGLTDQMGQLGDMAFSKHMTEGKDARASAEAAAQRGWQGDLTTSEGKADRKNAWDIANIPKEKNYKPSDPKDMWDNVTIGMILSDVGTSLGILPITNDFGRENPDYGKILSDSRSKAQAYDAIDSLILKGKLPEGSGKLYRKMVDRFFEQQGSMNGSNPNSTSLLKPDVTSPDLTKITSLWERWKRLGKPDAMRGTDSQTMQEILRFDVSQMVKEGGTGY